MNSNVNIYKLKLHETTSISLDNGFNQHVTRVAGGWIYQTIRLDRNLINSIFVPFNNEFQPIRAEN